MKKFVVLLVVVAISCLSAAAFASDISVSGSIDIRTKDFVNTEALPSGGQIVPGTNTMADNGTDRSTQERVRLNIDAKAGDVKGRISIENDWDTWGRLEAPQANGTGGGNASFPDFREAWINFNLPGVPVNVNAGHQLLQLGNGWFLRNMKYGDDAWVVANVTGANTAAFVDIKAAEVNKGDADDVDAYAFLDVIKLSDDLTVGADLSLAKDRKSVLAFPGTTTNLYNLGLNMNGKFGPVVLKAELDLQGGKAKDANKGMTNGVTQLGDAKFKGNEIVVQGMVPMDPVTINFGVARGSGDKPGDALNQEADFKGFKNFLDNDQHYTFLYEYKVPTAAGGTHTGFANTTALNVGGKVAAAKSLTIGADLWYLMATEAQNINGAIDPATGLASRSRKVGTEVDVQIKWEMYDALSWNWNLGYFKPGAAYDSNDALTGALVSADKVMGVQGVISYKF
jgi:hypothetical protein